MSRNICSQFATWVVVPLLWRGLVAAIASSAAFTTATAQTYTTYRVLYVETNPDRTVADEALPLDAFGYPAETQQAAADHVAPLDAFGYLGGLLEARFYEPHTTTDDPRYEIQDAASLYGLDFAMMMSIARVESDFDPGAHTGSYKGLFQLSDYEFRKYGDGSVWNARDNARAAAHMFLVQAEMFRWALGHYPDHAERYMVHQQGIQGAIEHYTHPGRVAWQSMCATDEGLLKGEKWCKRCIWGNLLPKWKDAFGSVDNIHSEDFIGVWTGRIDHFATRYATGEKSASASPKSTADTRHSVKLARNEPRASRSSAAKARAKAAKTVAERAHHRPAVAHASPHEADKIAHSRIKSRHAIPTAPARVAANVGRPQK
jgi:hypothetical protein